MPSKISPAIALEVERVEIRQQTQAILDLVDEEIMSRSDESSRLATIAGKLHAIQARLSHPPK